jgi:hypothetical protein
MGMLVETGPVQSETLKTGKIFESLFPDFFRSPVERPSVYLATCWSMYQRKHPDEDVGTNGKYFELCMATLLVRENIVPFYMQATVAFVPNVDYDFILSTADRGSLCMSVKTTLRERWKQADLEAVALKYVHRRAQSYLVNISEDESRNLQQKILQGGVIGLDASIYALSQEFDDFIASLKEKSLILSPEVRVIESELIITSESIHRVRR